jgi:hypothetical protein
MIERGSMGLAAAGEAITRTATISATAPKIPILLLSMYCVIAIGI